MGSALQHLASLLERRQLDHTIARHWTLGAAPSGGRFVSTGVEGLDAALTGGWCAGEVSEIVGPRSSGRTSLLLATMAAATDRGEVVGLVDAVDRFDPTSAAAMGVDLSRVLWVRGPAVSVEMARLPMLEPVVRRAIRAGDLIVRAGGFGLVVIDLADLPVRVVRGLPFTTWLRLAHANEARDTVCLLVGEAPMGRSARGVSVRCDAVRAWTGTSRQSRRFDGFDVRVGISGVRRAGGARDATFRV